MELPAALLLDAARKFGGRAQNCENSDAFGELLLWSGGVPARAGALYAATRLPPEVPGISFADEAALFGFFNEAGALASRLNAWSARLDYAAAQGDSVQNLIELTAQAFQNPVILADPSMKRIACSRSVTTDDVFTREFMELGYPTPQTYEKLDRASYYDARYYSGGPKHMHTVDEPHTDVVLQAVRIGGRLRATVYMLFENTPYAPGFEAVIDHLVEKLRGLLDGPDAGDAAGDTRQYAFLLTDILSGMDISEAEAEARLAYAKYPRWRQCGAVVVDCADRRPARLEYRRKLLAEQFADSFPIVYEGRLLATLRLEDGSDTLRRLDGFLQAVDGRAGVSDPMESLTALKRGYEQALRALEFGVKLDEKALWRERGAQNGRLYRYGDYAAYDAIRGFGGSDRLRELCRPALLRLRALDAERDTDMMKTLYAFLTGSRSYTAAAKKLFIHRNSLMYRMERICELLGVSEISQELEFELLFSYRVLDVIRILED